MGNVGCDKYFNLIYFNLITNFTQFPPAMGNVGYDIHISIYFSSISSLIYLHFIQQWEMLVVAKLNWDLNLVTAVDFVDVLLGRLGIMRDSVLRRHAVTFVSIAVTGKLLMQYCAVMPEVRLFYLFIYISNHKL